MTVIMKNHATGVKREVPSGFSVTSLFFGVLVPLFRGDVLIAVALTGAIILTMGFGAIFVWLWLAFGYNDYGVKQLENAGWVQVPANE